MKTTQKQFKEFKEEFKRFIEVFNLRDWRVFYYLEKLENQSANVNYNVETREAVVKLSTVLPDNDNVLKLAQHEAAHLLLAPLYTEVLEKVNPIEKYYLGATEESITVVIENLDL
jgi:hypothetical protein